MTERDDKINAAYQDWIDKRKNVSELRRQGRWGFQLKSPLRAVAQSANVLRSLLTEEEAANLMGSVGRLELCPFCGRAPEGCFRAHAYAWRVICSCGGQVVVSWPEDTGDKEPDQVDDTCKSQAILIWNERK